MVRKINTDPIKASLVKTAGILLRSKKSPDELLGELFNDVQSQQIYSDGKTFVDLVPRTRVRSIQEEYKLLKKDPHFDLRDFIGRHFYDLSTTVHKKDPFVVKPKEPIAEHIDRLWTHLERRNRIDRGSLIALPHAYIVPGGRFSEQFYWDSYFIMIGLAAEGKWKQVEDIVKNCAHMIRKYGYIPTANRTYFLSRSQPPFFVMMVRLLAQHKGKRILREYLPLLLQEYRFWMKGSLRLKEEEHFAYRRVAQLPSGVLVNRYYDNKVTPRPESLREDKETALGSESRVADRMFLHLRAAAESGWDFSSRWFKDPGDIKTIHTADIIPIDLNSLLYALEETIADAYRTLFHPLMVRRYRKRAAHRKEAINTYLWSEPENFYMDYNFHTRKRTGVLSLAAVFPLYAGIATNEQAQAVAERLKKDFLKEGGLVTTLIENGQQWDSPNGWAPLQWVAVEGLRRYGYDELADEITKRWTKLVEKVYKHSHKLVEKYNVVGGDGLGSGGEYLLQDGFGWTNGVYIAMKNTRD
ncbi:MAG: alpha,alpha-trehalase TreF [Candidatus Microsaccharimonas sp.]